MHQWPRKLSHSGFGLKHLTVLFYLHQPFEKEEMSISSLSFKLACCAVLCFVIALGVRHLRPLAALQCMATLESAVLFK